jgi:hypothetical protein
MFEDEPEKLTWCADCKIWVDYDYYPQHRWEVNHQAMREEHAEEAAEALQASGD